MQFDDVAIMTGTREKGRDCGLYLKGKPVGLIQCKRYSTPVDTATCIDEILKFVLNSILEPDLIQPHGTFSYYFTAASGFKNDTNDFLANFAKNIAAYSQIIERCEKVKKDFPTLKSIDIAKELPFISNILSRIIVVRLTNLDLDTYLNKSHIRVLLPAFFQTQTVLNEEGSQALVEINEREKSGGLPKTHVIMEKFSEASSILRNQIKSFGHSKKHIPRHVVNDIRTSINQPYNQESGNIIFLPGKAGMGKSVVMSDLLEALEKDQIPTLAIKADKQFATSIPGLERKLALAFSVVDAIKKLTTEYERVVLLIDQIDVLSQSFSTNKEYLNVVIDLVSRLIGNDRLRIVVSVRKFDLEHNNDLRFFHATKRTVQFELTELHPEEVKSVLDALEGSFIHLSPSLSQLLRVPKNLDLFCLIYNPKLDTGKLSTEYDLLGELWKALISNEKERALNLTGFIYQFAGLIERESILSLKRSQFDHQFSDEISSLLSQGILTSSQDELQFFHQTFLDYVIARQFHEQNRDLLEFILGRRNELNIRSTVRAVMYYFSQVSSTENYLVAIQKVLRSSSVTFNIKMVIVESIARDTHNQIKLNQWIRQFIILNDRFSQAFFEHLDNATLLNLALKEKWLDSFLTSDDNGIRQTILAALTKFDSLRIWLAIRGIEPVHYNNRLNIIYRLLHNRMNYHPEAILRWLKEAKCIDEKDRITFQLLNALNNWAFPVAFELLDSVIHLFKKGSYGTYWILEKISEHYPTRAFKLYVLHIFSQIDFLKSSYQYPGLDHHESEFLGKIAKKIPFDLLTHYLPLIDKLSNAASEAPELAQCYFHELNLSFFNYNSDRRDNELLTLLIDASRECSLNSRDLFLELFEKHKQTKSESVLIVLIFGLKESAGNFIEQSYELIKLIHDKTLFDLDGSLSWYFRQFLKQAFPFMSVTKQKEILSWILEIQPEHDQRVHEWNGKKHYPKWSGQIKLKFLQAIPNDQLVLVSDAKKEFNELTRKFPNAIEEAPHGVRAYSIRAPLTKQAYEKMTLDNWKESFVRYNTESERAFGSDKGGLTEHSRSFTAEVAKRPDFFFEFILTLTEIEEIPFEYSIAGLDGLIKGNYTTRKVNSLFEKLILPARDRYDVMRLVWHSDYLIKNDFIQVSLLDFLINQVQYNLDPSADNSDSSPIQKGINSVRGAAIDRIMSIAWNSPYFEQLISVIENVANDPSAAVRASLFSKLQLLIKHDRKRTYDLFYKLLNNDPHPEFWKISIHTAQYLVHGHYPDMNWYFKGMLEDEELSKSAVRILAKYHIWTDTNCRSLMEAFFNKFPSTIPDLIYYLDAALVSEHGTKNRKATQLYWSFLNIKNLKTAEAYNSNMLHFKPEHFDLHKQHIIAFSKSYAGKHSHYYLWHYLLNCVSRRPLDCLDLVSRYTISDLDNLERDYIDDKLVRLIMAIYSHLNGTNNTEEVNESINTVLDRVLLSEKYRSSISKALVLSEE